MENATKALMIAGAVLLAIMIIAIGMSIYNGAKGSVDAGLSSMNDTEKQILNGKFEPYAARAQTGSQIKTMLAAVISYNATQSEEQTGRSIKVTCGTDCTDSADSTAISKASSAVIPGKKYNVTLTYTSGVVTGITVALAST